MRSDSFYFLLQGLFTRVSTVFKTVLLPLFPNKADMDFTLLYMKMKSMYTSIPSIDLHCHKTLRNRIYPIATILVSSKFSSI